MLSAALLLLGFEPANSSAPESQTTPMSYEMTQREVSIVVARLAEAQAIARTDGPLPFSLSCLDERESGACAHDGRTALATMPLDAIAFISPIYNTTCLRTLFEYSGDICPASVDGQPRTIDAYAITMSRAVGDGMTWKIGLAGPEKTTAIEIELGTIIYH